VGFLLFAVIPAGIAFWLIVKSNMESKRINKYFLSVFLATFLTILITAIAGKMIFLTKYLTELYPILILMTALGWAEINSQNTRITLATIYIFMSLFFIVVSHTMAIHLV